MRKKDIGRGGSERKEKSFEEKKGKKNLGSYHGVQGRDLSGYADT